MAFVEDGRKYRGRPKMFIDLEREDGHWPLDRDQLFDGQPISTNANKVSSRSKKLKVATVVMCDDNSGDFFLQWSEEENTGKVWKRSVFSAECAQGTCGCKEESPYLELFRC